MRVIPYDTTGHKWNPYAVRGLRARLGITQRDLAGSLHVSLASVNRWERGITTPSPLAVTMLDLIDLTKILPPPPTSQVPDQCS